MAFMWLMGSGVSRRSAPHASWHRPPASAYHVPAHRKYSLGNTQPFGRLVVPDVYNSAHSVFLSGALSAKGAGCGTRAKLLSSGDVTTTSHPALRAARATSNARADGTTATESSEWPMRYS